VIAWTCAFTVCRHARLRLSPSRIITNIIGTLLGEKIFAQPLAQLANPDPGSGAILTHGSGIADKFFPDSESNKFFESLVIIFWIKIL
jgi:hypothetical protein